MNSIQDFQPEIISKLKYYVYRLIDPRNGETFYIGKGEGNRVFAHAKAAINDDTGNKKLKKIRELQTEGFSVQHIIHRHGMDSSTAIEVEAALIDAYPGLTNMIDGANNEEYGCMHAMQIKKKYCAEVAEIKDKSIIISVNKSIIETSLYEATRYAWRLSKQQAEQAKYVIAVSQGLIRGVFIAEKWLAATKANFPGRETIKDRYGFVGREAPESVKEQYIGKRLPAVYRKRGASNPIKYSWNIEH